MTILEIQQILKPDLKKLAALNYSAATVHECVEAYCQRRDQYNPLLEQLSKAFMGDSAIKDIVHSVRYRTKEPSHLVSKLARKALDDDPLKRRCITPDCLFDPDGVTDLGGIRVLHLYKSQWLDIHRYILETLCRTDFVLHQKLACIRRGESPEYYHKAKNGGFGFDEKEIEVRKSDYASLHYVLRSAGCGNPLYIECQVRTIFEEGWGEIDHKWRYPDTANPIVTNQLRLLNNTSSLANDLASTLGDMKHYLPTFIPWDVEQRMERSADEVYCATPKMDWVARYIDEFVTQLKDSETLYFYWYITASETIHNVDVVRKRLRQEGLQDRVRFAHIPKLLLEIFPLFSDVLLLRNAQHHADQSYQDVAVMSAPAPAALQPKDHLDIVIYDLQTVHLIREFFKKLEEQLGV